MNLSPILPGLSATYSNASLDRGIGCAFGRIWKTLYQTPNQLYDFMLLIQTAVIEYLCGSPEQYCKQNSISSRPSKQPHAWRYVPNEDLFKDDSSLQVLFEKEENTKSAEKLSKEDGISTDVEEKIDSSSSLNNDSDVVLLLQSPSGNGELNMVIIRSIKKDNAIPSTAQIIVQSALDIRNEIQAKRPKDLQDFLISMQQLDKELESLKDYASKIDNVSKERQLIQNTIKAIEDKRQELDKKVCEYVRSKYKPNPHILSDGHCLFWSIKEALKSEKGPKFYRKLAADYIRSVPQNFIDHIKDTCACSLSCRKQLASYVRAQGGKDNWIAKLAKGVVREFTEIDLYCDCLENSNFWGGYPEIKALSSQLEVPILVFSRQNQTTWRFDIGEIPKEMKDKPPILLYYNGVNHYQNLVPKS